MAMETRNEICRTAPVDTQRRDAARPGRHNIDVAADVFHKIIVGLRRCSPERNTVARRYRILDGILHDGRPWRLHLAFTAQISYNADDAAMIS